MRAWKAEQVVQPRNERAARADAVARSDTAAARAAVGREPRHGFIACARTQISWCARIHASCRLSLRSRGGGRGRFCSAVWGPRHSWSIAIAHRVPKPQALPRLPDARWDVTGKVNKSTNRGEPFQICSLYHMNDNSRTKLIRSTGPRG